MVCGWCGGSIMLGAVIHEYPTKNTEDRVRMTSACQTNELVLAHQTACNMAAW
jgi:hypothetical protein